MTPSRFRQIEDIYNEARDRTPDERTAYLAKACAGDQELRREVESLLAQDASRTNTLDRPAREGKADVFPSASTVTVLAAGMQLGPYKIEGPLGKGGMGEVFRAIDTRLGRPVAIKTSNEQFSDRFEREARAISALNHPHICTLYDVGATPSGTSYLVMELIEGESLATRLKRGKLSIPDTLKYGQQIADALAAAHAKGIVHRDLKPHNVMVTKLGVKVLDFGLAKAAQDDTITLSRAVMGTPAYMAPELFHGREADARSDIYALGLVLFEMGTGKRLPQGEVAELSHLPPQLAHVVERCLAQDSEERWQSAKDVQAELAWAARLPVPEKTSSSPVPHPWAWAALGFAAALAAATLIIFQRSQGGGEEPVQFDLLFDRTAYADLPRVSPNGRTIVYPEVDASGRRQLWLRELDSESAKPLAGTDDALFPFWSPDGREIGFYAQRKLKKIGRDGGSAQTIIALAAFDGTVAWSSTHEILYAPGNRTGLYKISDAGGTPQEFTKLDASRTENSHRLVRFLPDGRHFLFSARCANRENNSLYSGTIDSNEIHRIAPIQSNVAYVPARNGQPASVVFAREGVLYRQAFDGTKLAGEPGRLTEVAYRPISLQGMFDISLDGRVLLSRAPYTTEQRLTWFDRRGMNLGTLGSPGTFEQPTISPNGTRVLFNRPDDNGGNRDVWMIETARGAASRLTVSPANEWDVIWAPDERRIAFASDRNGKRDGSTWIKTSMDPGAEEQPIEGLPDWANPEDWSADGKWIIFSNGAVHGEVWVAPTFGDRKPFRFFDSGFDDRIPRFSPDGKWISYHSNETGRFEVYIRPFAGRPAESGQKVQISLQGGFYATWNRTGKELFFIGPDAMLYSVPLAELSSSNFAPTPRALFTVCAGNRPTGSSTEGSGFDVSPDGTKFLFACSNELPNKYTVTVNWQNLKPR